jgi:hypothetical protein
MFAKESAEASPNTPKFVREKAVQKRDILWLSAVVKITLMLKRVEVRQVRKIQKIQASK